MANLFPSHAWMHGATTRTDDRIRVVEQDIVDFDGDGDSETAFVDVLYGDSLPDPFAPAALIERLAA